MGSMSIWHWILVLAVGLLLFGGRGKISELMGDFAKGIKAFKKGMTEEIFKEAMAVVGLANGNNNLVAGYQVEIDEQFL